MPACCSSLEAARDKPRLMSAAGTQDKSSCLAHGHLLMVMLVSSLTATRRWNVLSCLFKSLSTGQNC